MSQDGLGLLNNWPRAYIHSSRAKYICPRMARDYSVIGLELIYTFPTSSRTYYIYHRMGLDYSVIGLGHIFTLQTSSRK